MKSKVIPSWRFWQRVKLFTSWAESYLNLLRKWLEIIINCGKQAHFFNLKNEISSTIKFLKIRFFELNCIQWILKRGIADRMSSFVSKSKLRFKPEHFEHLKLDPFDLIWAPRQKRPNKFIHVLNIFIWGPAKQCIFPLKKNCLLFFCNLF